MAANENPTSGEIDTQAPIPEGAEGEALEGGEAQSGKKKKIFLFAGIGFVLLLLITIAALYFTGTLGGLLKKEEVKVAEVHKEQGKPGEAGVEGGIVEQAVYYDLEEFIVNLNVGSKRPSFLKMTVSLELPGESQIPEIEAKMPRIRDSFQIYLRELRIDDLQGSAGIYRLREELLLRINKVVYPAKVNDVLFKEILVQ